MVLIKVLLLNKGVLCNSRGGKRSIGMVSINQPFFSNFIQSKFSLKFEPFSNFVPTQSSQKNDSPLGKKEKNENLRFRHMQLLISLNHPRKTKYPSESDVFTRQTDSAQFRAGNESTASFTIRPFFLVKTELLLLWSARQPDFKPESGSKDSDRTAILGP